MRNIYLLHGLMGTSYSHFAAQILAWQSRHNVVPIDLPGHGRATQTAAHPYFANAVELLWEQMRRTGPGDVIGISYLGSSISLRCALAYPELFSSLVLSGYVPEMPQEVMDKWAGAFHNLAEQNLSLAEMYDALHGSRWRETLGIVTVEIREEYLTTVAVTKSMVAGLRVPMLLVNGSLRSDERAAVVDLPQHNPLVQVGLIPGAGHIATHDQPEVFNLIVEGFWKRVGNAKLTNDKS